MVSFVWSADRQSNDIIFAITIHSPYGYIINTNICDLYMVVKYEYFCYKIDIEK
jgi:hypothetical protein